MCQHTFHLNAQISFLVMSALYPSDVSQITDLKNCKNHTYEMKPFKLSHHMSHEYKGIQSFFLFYIVYVPYVQTSVAASQCIRAADTNIVTNNPH